MNDASTRYICVSITFVYRAFKHPVHNEIVELVIRRVKSMLAYPEMQGDLVQPPSLLYRYKYYMLLHVNIFTCIYVY